MASDPTESGEKLPTIYDLVGGQAFFVELIDYFYDGVDTDPTIRHMYPEDLTDSRTHMVGFLSQYWGGPTDYSDQRGHPRLRMRHAPFQIDEKAKDAWMGHMMNAVQLASSRHSLHPELTKAISDYFVMASTHMVNA